MTLCGKRCHSIPICVKICCELCSCIPGPVILPELVESLGRYTQKVLARRGVEVRLNTRVKSMTENRVFLIDGLQIPSRTLVWTAGTVPNPLTLLLPCANDQGRIRVNEFLR